MSDDPRKRLMLKWLSSALNLDLSSCEPASADASFRRYFRIILTSDSMGLSSAQRSEFAIEDHQSLNTALQDEREIDRSDLRSYIVMDAPPEKEPLKAFIKTTLLLRNNGIRAPQIHQTNLKDGFLILEDFGSVNYLDKLQGDSEKLYSEAIAALIILQIANYPDTDPSIPFYSREKLLEELQLFEEWFLGKHLRHTMSESQKAVWNHLKTMLVDQCLEQPQVWVHRDFHSRNLMVLAHDSPGIIDYQDMVVGPISYDPASLFKDCYIEWPRSQQLDWLRQYYDDLNSAVQKLPVAVNIQFSFEQLIYWFDMTALQRHLKVLGIFCRLNYRDNKSNYINDLPMVKRYINDVLPRYKECTDFLDSFDQFLH